MTEFHTRNLGLGAFLIYLGYELISTEIVGAVSCRLTFADHDDGAEAIQRQFYDGVASVSDLKEFISAYYELKTFVNAAFKNVAN
jgi:hypothetical protein